MYDAMAVSLNPADERILEIIQSDLPLVPRPFRQLGEVCGLTEEECLARIRDLMDRNIIREISAIYNAARIGYKSTLVAASLPETRVEEAAGNVNRHPGVSHNYLRSHHYNLWFTLTVPSEKDFTEEIRRIDRENLFESFRVLPALRTFKIDVRFTFGSRPQGGSREKKNPNREHAGKSSAAGADTVPVNLTGDRIKLLRELQRPFPAVPEPWNIIADACGTGIGELFTEIRSLKQCGAIKRIAGVLRHRRAGFAANGMACFAVPENRMGDAGESAARFNEVSHCYQRPRFPDWPYTLFAMVHGRTREECETIIDEIADAIQCQERTTLFSDKEFKKERVKYFWEET